MNTAEYQLGVSSWLLRVPRGRPNFTAKFHNRHSKPCHRYPAFGVTLRQNQREWYYSRLDEHFPGLRYEYAKQFGNAYECRSPRASELWRVLCVECDRLGILYRMEDIIDAYREPHPSAQLSLF